MAEPREGGMKLRSEHPSRSSFTASLLLLAFISPVSQPVTAVDFVYGDMYGSFDTTFSYGQLHRVQSRDRPLIGVINGGTAFSVNSDDGNLNYDSGLISSALKFTSELELNYKNFGALFRGTGFKDTSNDDANDTERTFLTDQAINLVGEDLSLLDAYVWADFNIGNRPLNLRVGEQVVSWGESTFITNSINIINPVDVSKLRVPGAELKEALLPVGMVFGSLGLTDNISVEAFYQYDYERILIEPPGSYFSTNDFVGQGGSCVTLGFGVAVPDYPLLALGDRTTTSCAFPLTAPGSAGRSPDDRPDEGGQYGAALRVFVPALNDTEFGFYYVNYHSRLPIINAVAPAIFTPPFNVFGGTYFISYPEDIKLYGMSFNTQLGSTGIALQGEYSFRDDTPLQVDDVELLYAALGLNAIGVPSQLGTFTAGSIVPGFIKRDVSQIQMTATKVFGPTFKADQALLLGEFGVTHVHDMPSKNTLRLEVPGTNLPAPFASVFPTRLAPALQSNDDFADVTSWGYRIVGRLDYNNVIGAINFQPRLAWQHDVDGTTPGPGGNFLDGRKALQVGVAAVYQNEWTADFSYTSFFGAGDLNLLNDHDFTAFSISYSF